MSFPPSTIELVLVPWESNLALVDLGNSLEGGRLLGSPLEELLLKEKQLQELLAREAELTPAQREELLRQLSLWPQEEPEERTHQLGSVLVGTSGGVVCHSTEHVCRKMLHIPRDLPLYSESMKPQFKVLLS